MKVEVAVLAGLPAPNSPYGLCGRKATLTSIAVRLWDTEGSVSIITPRSVDYRLISRLLGL